nr:MAG TPA: hypothetical protein [Caudoviricetes sp.]
MGTNQWKLAFKNHTIYIGIIIIHSKIHKIAHYELS